MSTSRSLAVVLALIVATTTGLSQTAQAPNTLTASERAAGWRLLFDGTTTAGWHPFGKEAAVAASKANGWDVGDGTLVALGQGTRPRPTS